METIKFDFPEYLEHEFLFRLQRVNKKLAKYGQEVKVLNKYIKPILVEPKFDSFPGWSVPDITAAMCKEVKYVFVEITKPEITGKKDVEFIGIASMTKGVKSIYNTSDKYNLFEHINRGCEHCNTNRIRTKYFFFEERGKLKSIGSTCVNEYFGLDLIKMLGMFEREFKDIEEEFGRMGSGDYGKYFTDLLTMTAFMCKDGHWKSQTIHEYYRRIENIRNGSDEDLLIDFQGFCKERVTDEWIEDIKVKVFEYYFALDPKNDFEFNMKESLIDENELRLFLPNKVVGVAAYAIFAILYPKKDKIEEKKTNKLISSWVGTLGEKIELPVKVELTRVLEGDYGSVLLVKFIDTKGNILNWYNSGNSWSDFQEGEEINIKGTVKDHGIYKEEKVTKLTRVKSLS